MASVTPWEVKGNVDYAKLIKDFGVAPIDEKLLERLERHSGHIHHFLRRGIFFAHRDLTAVLDSYEKGEPFFLYTGRAPSGHTHLGHLVPWMFTKWLQDTFKVDLWFQFPDEEKFLFKRELTLEDTANFTTENMLDVIALGFDPKRTHFIVDTRHAGIMYKQAVRVAKHVTYSNVKATFGFKDDQNIGMIFYTAMQAVPAFLPSVIANKPMHCLIPHAIDQDPHFRLTRDVLPKLGYPKPASIQCRFLPGLGGMQDDGKMSSSAHDTTAIFTTDNAATVKKKINKYAFSGGATSIEEHRAKGGNPDVDIPYQWLTFFEEDDELLRELHDKYRSGHLLSGEMKEILITKLNAFLANHQQQREAARKKIDQFVYKEK